MGWASFFGVPGRRSGHWVFTFAGHWSGDEVDRWKIPMGNPTQNSGDHAPSLWSRGTSGSKGSCVIPTFLHTLEFLRNMYNLTRAWIFLFFLGASRKNQTNVKNQGNKGNPLPYVLLKTFSYSTALVLGGSLGGYLESIWGYVRSILKGF